MNGWGRWFLLGCLLLSGATAARGPLLSTATVTLKMGLHNFPPDFVVTKDGQHCGGQGLELTRQIFQPLHVRIEPVCLTPARMYLLLDSGEIDLTINIRSTRQVKLRHHFIAPPYRSLQLMLYSHPRSSQTSNQQSVALIRGFDYEGERQKLLQQGYQLQDLPDSISAIEFFLLKRSQYLLTYQGPFSHYLQDHPAAKQQLPARKLQQIDTFYLLSDSSPHLALMRQQLQAYASQHQCRYLLDCQVKP